MSIIKIICKILVRGTNSTKERKRAIRYAIGNSYTSMKIEGRGTIYVDPSEVRNNMESENLFDRAERIVNSK